MSRLRYIPCMLALVALVGCASVSGAPEPVSRSGTLPSPTGDIGKAIAAYEAKNADPARQKVLRNNFIARYMAAADDRYDEFVANLSKEMHGTNVALDIGTLALTGVGAVVRGAASELSAGAAVLTGSRATINRELYFERALPAIITSMDANRLRVAGKIATQRRLDVSEYSIDDALLDLREYERAGNINRGFNQLSEAARSAFNAAEKEFPGARDSCAPNAALGAPRRRVNQFLYGIRNRWRTAPLVAGGADDQALDRIVTAMNRYGLTPNTKASTISELESQIDPLTTALADACTVAEAEAMATAIIGA